MLELIPELESNAGEISSVVSAYSDMETYDVATKNIILTSRDGLKITFDITTYIQYLRESIESFEIRLHASQKIDSYFFKKQ